MSFNPYQIGTPLRPVVGSPAQGKTRLADGGVIPNGAPMVWLGEVAALLTRLPWQAGIWRGFYTGPCAKFYGQRAQLRAHPTDCGKVLVQFDDRNLGRWAYGWHRLPRNQFRFDMRCAEFSVRQPFDEAEEGR